MDNSLLINKFFKNSLTDKEKIFFNDLMEKDTAFHKAFEEHKSMQRAFEINEAERLKDKLKSIETEKVKPLNSSRQKRWVYSIAASVLVIVGLSVFLNYFNITLYDEYFEPYPNVYQPVVRGTAEEGAKAFMYYENQDYTNAQKAFENLLKEENNPNIRFYYALSFLNENNVKRANEELETLKDINFEFQAEVIWYQSLSLIKLNKFKEAKILLQTLKTKGYSFNSDKVDTLIENLD
jgi:tetratricopeptide (TPR) repeat protein